ncbi:hypothetical protein U1Q18_020664 [Sarracenia purpurea var. burkii]
MRTMTFNKLERATKREVTDLLQPRPPFRRLLRPLHHLIRMAEAIAAADAIVAKSGSRSGRTTASNGDEDEGEDDNGKVRSNYHENEKKDLFGSESSVMKTTGL